MEAFFHSPLTTTVDKFCLFLTFWKKLLVKGTSFCSLCDLKLLLAGRCLSCWDRSHLFFFSSSLSPAQCLNYDRV